MNVNNFLMTKHQKPNVLLRKCATTKYKFPNFPIPAYKEGAPRREEEGIKERGTWEEWTTREGGTAWKERKGEERKRRGSYGFVLFETFLRLSTWCTSCSMCHWTRHIDSISTSLNYAHDGVQITEIAGL